MGLPDHDGQRNPMVVLASASPRRADLLRQLGIPFERVISPADEPPPSDSNAAAGDYAVGAARVKARAVYDLVAEGGGTAAAPRGHPFIVVGADTVVVDEGGAVLGKPGGPGEATGMLRRLSGLTHHVYTGVVVVGPDAVKEQSGCEVTEVVMRSLSDADIAGYVATGEPLDKAGAYGIQGRGGRFIERINGCYYNVVGLPLVRLSAMLENAGFDFGALD